MPRSAQPPERRSRLRFADAPAGRTARRRGSFHGLVAADDPFRPQPPISCAAYPAPRPSAVAGGPDATDAIEIAARASGCAPAGLALAARGDLALQACRSGPVAQGIEQQPSKLKVAGSNPAGVATPFHKRPFCAAFYAGLPPRISRFANRCCRFICGGSLIHSGLCHVLLFDLVDVDSQLAKVVWPLTAMISGAVQPACASSRQAAFRSP